MQGLTQIGVGGFKSLKNVQDLRLGPLNVLIGANGSGKSNLISLLRMLNAIGEARLQRFVSINGYSNRLLHYGAKETPFMWCSLNLSINNENSLYRFELAAGAEDSLIFKNEELDLDNDHHDLGSDHRESGLVRGKYHFPEIEELLTRIRIFRFGDTTPNSSIRKAFDVDFGQKLYDDGSNLASVLYRLQKSHRDVYQRILAAIKQVAPFFHDFSLVPDGDMILLRWRDRYSNYEFSVDQLSDGTLRAIAMITLLLQPEDELPPVIVLDEPELGLHPYALEVLASLLRRASASCQIIVATQSISLVNQFQPEDIIVATRDGSSTDFKRLRSEDLEKWLDEYAVGDLWRKNLIGGTPYK